MWAIHKRRLGAPVGKQTAGTPCSPPAESETESQTETDPQVGQLLLGCGCGLSKNLTLIRWEE